MIYDRLFDWQKKIVDQFIDRKSLGLWLEMGLGKTSLSLAFAEAHKCDKVLIVTTNKKASEDESVDWSFLWWAKKMEIRYNLHDKRVSFRGKGPKKWQRDISPDTKDILIINYEALWKRPSKDQPKVSQCELCDIVTDFIASCKRRRVAVIVDESHKIKDTSSIQTMALKKIETRLGVAGAEEWLYLLTGTPFTQGFIDLYSQLKMLGWEMNKSQFIDMFCVKGDQPGLMGRRSMTILPIIPAPMMPTLIS